MSCVPLAQSTLCPGFRQYNAYVNLGQDVDAYIAESVRVSPSEFGFGQAMVKQYGCSGWTGAGLRYHLSALCALLVSNGNAAGCNAPAVAPLPLCASTLGAYVASFAGVAADAACVSRRVRGARRLRGLPSRGCCRWRPTPPAASAAEPVDAANCGFATPPEAAAFCAASADACCDRCEPCGFTAAAATTTAAPLQTSAVAATTATTTTTTTKPASSPPASESSGGLSSQTIIYIAAGGGGGRRKSNATAAATYTVNEKGALTTAAPVYGKTHVAVHGYSPIQNDELGIQAGDSIVIKTEYDD
ncbi:hypothetical protein BDR26DRAFT_921633, partial [Obelidium mucronatum]